MLETSARLLKLLALLQAHREWPGPELARRLEVSQRTIRNDIDRLRQLGYPVEATRGTAGGYRLGPGATMPPLLLEDDEAVAIAVSLGRAATGGITNMDDASTRALVKLESVLPTRLRRRVEALRGFAETVAPLHRESGADPETLALLANACRDREAMRIAYTRHDGETSRRIIEPYRLVNWGHRWYLAAFDPDRDDWRTFRLDRISRLEPTGHRFTTRPLPDADLTAYITRNVARASWQYRAQLILEAPADQMIERLHGAFAIIEPLDEDRCMLTCGADTPESMAIGVGFIDVPFTVAEGPELIAAMRSTIDRYGHAITGNPIAQGRHDTT
ncbi:MAG: YafY family protein [Thermomicrobiales bacterium]